MVPYLSAIGSIFLIFHPPINFTMCLNGIQTINPYQSIWFEASAAELHTSVESSQTFQKPQLLAAGMEPH